MFNFRPADYGSAVADLLDGQDLCVLGPGRPQHDRLDELQKLRIADLGKSLKDHDMARCCLAALWLRHDFLDASHEISQDVPTSSGSYWHAIMHRREPDYSNSKYWYRRVGEHPIYPSLQNAVATLAEEVAGSPTASSLARQTSWDPFAFVDFCQASADESSEDQQFARQVATLEWEILFDYCYRAAV